MKKLILFTAAFYFTNKITFAQPGRFDPTFGNQGIVKTDLGSAYDYADLGKQVLLKKNGSIYLVAEVAGITLVIKKLANGSTDVSYGNKGWSVAVGIHGACAALQSDGKIVVAGYVFDPEGNSNETDFAVARFNTDGSLDNSFNGDGIAITDQGTVDVISCIAIQADGKIVAGGYSELDETDPDSYILLLRYNTDGSLDNEIITDDIGQYNSLAIQGDGKILAAGDIDNGNDEDFEIVRYNTDLSLDSSFSGDGKQTLDLGSDDYINSVGIQSNGKIVVAGSSIARYNTNGSLDNTFNGHGTLTPGFVVSSLVMQKDGKIVVAGSINTGSNYNFAVARYNINGSLDITFDADGKKFTDFGFSNDYISSVAIQADGKLVALGYTANRAHTYIAATRYNINGSLDSSFDGDGKLTDHVNQGNTNFTSTAVQNDGKIVAAGNTWNGSNWDFALVRYKTDGSLDSTFSGDGKQTTDFGSTNDSANSVAIQSDGKIVVAGSAGGNFALARYNTNGSPDNTFSADGKQTTDFGSSDYIKKIVIQNDGKILAGGSTLARYNTDGSLDHNFKGNFLTSDDIAIQTDGKILSINNYNGSLSVSRYNSSGSVDHTFGDNGSAGIDIPGNGDGFVVGESIAIQNDGKIVIGGYFDAGARDEFTSFALQRINTDGTPDDTFNNGNGTLTTTFNYLDYVTSVKIQNDNKIIVAGSSYNGSDYDFTILRYNSDGSLNSTFNGNGVEATSTSTADDQIAGIAISGNKLYAVGYGQYPGNFGVVAKYLLDTSANKAPSVSLTTPANNAIYTAPAAFTLNAAASDPDGTITSVQFYNGTTLLTADSVSPYRYTINSLAAGNYSFVAKATDNKGLISNSATVAISVIAAANQAPVVNITSPANNAAYIAPATGATITLNAAASDTDGTVTSVKFYNGSTLLRTDSTSPYSCTISNEAPGNYKFYAKAIDNKGLSNSSATVSVFVIAGAANKAPAVSLTAPANNAIYIAPATITLNAAASDADGTITYVQFYNGSTLLKTDSTSPYSYTINNLATGTYSFVAKATDNNGLISNSATVAVAVSAGIRKAPVVNITGPANNATYVAPVTGATIILNASASDADGSITSVKFYNGLTLLKTDTTSPYSFTITNAATGTYKFYAKATDNSGLANSSATVSVFVVPGTANKAPVVSITNPANNATYSAPVTGAGITINADASDPDGTITNVQFYNGATLVATDSTSPYSCTINNIAAGNYSFVAKAIDNNGLISNSSTVAVSVSIPPNKAPVVNITGPANNATFIAPATITLNATASDPDGTITNVKFYDGSTFLKTVSKSPYSYTMDSVAAGNYKFYAKATDNNGLTNASASVYVVVTGDSNNASVPVTATNAPKVSSRVSSLNIKTGIIGSLSLKLSPNPAHSILNIYTTGLQQYKQTVVSVISASGVVMKTMRSPGSTQTIQLNVSSLASGMYIIKIISEDKVLYRQFVKM